MRPRPLRGRRSSEAFPRSPRLHETHEPPPALRSRPRSTPRARRGDPQRRDSPRRLWSRSASTASPRARTRCRPGPTSTPIWRWRRRAHADAALKAGGRTGPLHGVPIGIKDIFDTADLPTENGCPIFAGRRPRPTRRASAPARRRRGDPRQDGDDRAGAAHARRTRNPHNLAHTPGGSSAGSAAAVAAGMVPAALGSQTAGSVIRPASSAAFTASSRRWGSSRAPAC